MTGRASGSRAKAAALTGAASGSVANVTDISSPSHRAESAGILPAPSGFSRAGFSYHRLTDKPLVTLTKTFAAGAAHCRQDACAPSLRSRVSFFYHRRAPHRFVALHQSREQESGCSAV